MGVGKRLCTGQDMFRTTLILSLVSLSWQGPFEASYYPEQKSSALEKQDWTKYLTQDGGEEQDLRQYMVGEQFFKDGADDSSEDEEYGDQYDFLPVLSMLATKLRIMILPKILSQDWRI